MASSGGFNTSAYDGAYLRFDWSVKSQSVAANQSVISWKLSGAGIANGYWYKAGNFRVTINGETVFSSADRTNLYTGTVVASGDYTIPHDSDGTKTFSAYAEAGIYTVAVNCKGSGSWSLPTIARASVPSINTYPQNSPNFNIGDTIVIHMNRKSTQFTHKVVLNFGSFSYTVGSNVADNVRLDTSVIAQNMYAQTPNSNAKNGTIVVTTYNSGSVVGDASCAFTAHVVNSNPNFDCGYVDTNATTIGITGDNQYIIQNNSTLRVNLTGATAVNGASLSGAVVVINGTEYKGNLSGSAAVIDVGTVNVANDIVASVRLTDSRGNTTEKGMTIKVYGWNLPTAIIKMGRNSNYYSESGILVNADFASLGGKNDVTIKYRIKKVSDEDYGAYITAENGVASEFTADNEYEWNVQVLISDKIGSTTYNRILSKGLPIVYFDRKRNSVGINCFPQNDMSFEINGKTVFDLIYPVGAIYLSVNDVSPETLFGGTWEQIKDTFLLGAGDTYTAGASGGEATHVLTVDEMPRHNHSIDNLNAAGADTPWMTVQAQEKKGYGGNVKTFYSGGGKAHNNMPPYLTVYMWKRTK